jgi:carbon-monoxide dehydrogenase medium subunit
MALSYDSVSAVPSVWEPENVEAAWRLLKTLGSGSRFVAGGTLLRMQWESGIAPMPAHLISVASIQQINGIQTSTSMITIGAATALNECKKNPLLQKEFPHLIEAIRSIAAPAIRNMATLGGNILSTVGDSIPALLVIGAELNWFDGICRSTQSLQDWLQTQNNGGFPKEDRLLLSVQLPLESMNDSGNQRLGRFLTFYHKVGRREAFTPSIVTSAFQGRVNEAGTLIEFRVAAGGGARESMRLEESEELLNGSRYSPALLHKLQQVIRKQFITYSDAFASEQYRKNTAANLISSALWKALEASI